MSKSIFAFIVLLFAIALAVFGIVDLAYAQFGGPPPPPATPVQQPITSGLAALALAGGAYAVFKLKKKD